MRGQRIVQVREGFDQLNESGTHGERVSTNGSRQYALIKFPRTTPIRSGCYRFYRRRRTRP